MLNTGTGSGQRKMREDMRRAILSMLETGGRGIRWTDAVKQLGEKSSMKVDLLEFNEMVKSLENEGIVKVVGERDRRVIKRTEG